jgi:hypothetical protein
VHENFTRDAVKEKYANLIGLIDKGTEHIPNTTQLQLPKLQLPKLNKVKSGKSELPKLKLPKLNKV